MEHPDHLSAHKNDIAKLKQQRTDLNNTIDRINQGAEYKKVLTYASAPSEFKELRAGDQSAQIDEVLNFLKEGVAPVGGPVGDPVLPHAGLGIDTEINTEKTSYHMQEEEVNKFRIDPVEEYTIRDPQKVKAYKKLHEDNPELPRIEYADPGTDKFPIIKIRSGVGKVGDSHMGITNYSSAPQFLDDKELFIMAAIFVEKTYGSRAAEDEGKPMRLSDKTDKRYAAAVMAYCRLSEKGYEEPNYLKYKPGEYPLDWSYKRAMKAHLKDPDTKQRIAKVETALLAKGETVKKVTEKIEPKKGILRR
jgi:hypothetical protein